MDLNSSPLPLRRAPTVVPASPSAKTNLRIDFNYDSDELDELSVDTVPCSPYFTQPTQIVTQPTQIVNRISLRPPESPVTITSSSPRSVVEVPASSPFRTPKPKFTSGRLASALAPAGTAYRAPMAPPTRSSRKRAFNQCSSDTEADKPRALSVEESSDDGLPPRGDIKPSSFNKRSKPNSNSITSYFKSSEDLSAKPAASTTKGSNVKKVSNGLVEMLGRRLQKKFDWPLEKCKAAVAETGSIDAAEKALLNEGNHKVTAPAKNAAYIQSFAYNQSSSPPSNSSEEPEASLTPSPPPKSKKGRLQKGLRRREPSSSQTQYTVESAKKSQPAKLIDLTASDVEDVDDQAYSDRDATPETPDRAESQDGMDPIEERVLNYLNTCTADDIVAMCGQKKDKAEAMIAKRPFKSRQAARDAYIMKKARGKAKKVEIGLDIYDAVESYVQALDHIDKIIQNCETEGANIKSTTERWNVDFRGKKINDTVDANRLMTPSSTDGSTQLVDLPIPKEPRYVKGHCTMKTYQKYGLNWLALLYQHKFGCILADDMGLGKTCQVIALMAHLIGTYQESSGEARPWPNLIVVPPSVLANWRTEFEKFAPKLRITMYSGNQSERFEIATKIQKHPERHHVVLTSYSQLGQEADRDAMRYLQPNVAVFDEGHKMKNSTSKIYNQLLGIPAKWRLLLTGTPVQNNIMEMISLLRFIQPKIFDNHLEHLEALFNQRVSMRDVSNGALLLSERVARARSILEPFILQRRKEHVLSSLPPKTSRVVYCDLDETQKRIYKAYEDRFKRGPEDKAAGRTAAVVADDGRSNDNNNVWMQLRKAAIHAQLFRKFFLDKTVEKMAQVAMDNISQKELRQPNLKHLTNELKACSDFELHLWCRDYECLNEFDVPEESWMHSGKIQALLKLIEDYRANGDRVLVFTRFSTVIKIFHECFATAGISYLALEGETSVGERQGLIDEFNSNEDISVFALTTGAGGTGINLTAANKVIIFDQSINPQDDVQAENRAHRLGQEREVEIVRLVTRDSIEELIYKACQKKLELANRVVGWEQKDASTSEEVAARTEKEIEKEVREMLMGGGGGDGDKPITTPDTD
ncbi:uncharacterized protein E0L32_009622 [Thyridium curvatum]|uniref:Uncharacterized protein n=1 Tax=Thyridium curvatum TaxID=1093900 RepID=A0A507AVP9_9PEZI|nr:uncharacterized protein E0L32_009622 [Thyridium curvatum]TPX08918.1 hypothetical protein E0L32_009622 [Thyridium curvatum]